MNTLAEYIDEELLEHDIHARRVELTLPRVERRGTYAAVDGEAVTDVIVRPGSTGGVRPAVRGARPIERETWICFGLVGMLLATAMTLVLLDVPFQLGQLVGSL